MESIEEEDRVTGLVFVRVDPLASPAAELLAAMTNELNALYERPDRLDHPVLQPSEMAPPRGTYLVGWSDDQAVAGGGLRFLSDGVAEIKRMFVVPKFRRRGHAAALLIALEEAAMALGYHAVRLDTGPLQAHAQRLYEGSAYRAIDPYNDNPYACFWGQKELAGGSPA